MLGSAFWLISQAVNACLVVTFSLPTDWITPTLTHGGVANCTRDILTLLIRSFFLLIGMTSVFA